MDSKAQPNRNEPSYRLIPIHETGEPFVSLSNLSPKIKVFPYYFQQNVPGALTDCYLREGAAQRLVNAAEQLPNGLSFVVLDGWRPYEVQLALYEITKDAFRKKYGRKEENKDLHELSKFVAYPSANPDTPSPHMTGGAIDLTIANQDGWLDMGTEFDEFTERAQTDWYERIPNPNEREQKIQDNRRLLKQVMTAAGFKNYEQEWWHFDYGDQLWAMSTNQVAIYKGVKKVNQV